LRGREVRGGVDERRGVGRGGQGREEGGNGGKGRGREREGPPDTCLHPLI